MERELIASHRAHHLALIFSRNGSLFLLDLRGLASLISVKQRRPVNLIFDLLTGHDLLLLRGPNRLRGRQQQETAGIVDVNRPILDVFRGTLQTILIQVLLLHVVLQLHSVSAVGVTHLALEVVLQVLMLLKKRV